MATGVLLMRASRCATAIAKITSKLENSMAAAMKMYRDISVRPRSDPSIPMFWAFAPELSSRARSRRCDSFAPIHLLVLISKTGSASKEQSRTLLER